jgi:uncharacterized coiled-coil protein SlyX
MTNEVFNKPTILAVIGSIFVGTLGASGANVWVSQPTIERVEYLSIQISHLNELVSHQTVRIEALNLQQAILFERLETMNEQLGNRPRDNPRAQQ